MPVIQPAEVLTKEEVEQREKAKVKEEAREEARRSQNAPPPFQMPTSAQLGAFAGGLLSKVLGGNARVGAQIGRLAADQELRGKISEALNAAAAVVARKMKRKKT